MPEQPKQIPEGGTGYNANRDYYHRGHAIESIELPIGTNVGDTIMAHGPIFHNEPDLKGCKMREWERVIKHASASVRPEDRRKEVGSMANFSKFYEFATDNGVPAEVFIKICTDERPELAQYFKKK